MKSILACLCDTKSLQQTLSSSSSNPPFLNLFCWDYSFCCRNVKHPNIVQYYGLVEIDNTQYLVSPLPPLYFVCLSLYLYSLSFLYLCLNSLSLSLYSFIIILLLIFLFPARWWSMQTQGHFTPFYQSKLPHSLLSNLPQLQKILLQEWIIWAL